jgi:hypothetical protein
MPRVNLFIIGVNKAGTSWLYHMLAQHPNIYMSEVKELYFFGDADDGPADLEAYHDHFPFDDPYRYFGEATPMYYRDPAVADALYRYNPDAKLLAIVRDPIERLLSQYRYHKQLGILDENTSLQEALDGRDPRLQNDSHYENTLPTFANRFGPTNFEMVSLEEGRENPEQCWNQVLSFLDLPHSPYPDSQSRPENPTGSPAFRQVYRLTVRPIKNHAPTVYQWMLQSTLVRQTKLGLIRLLGLAESTTLSSDLKDRLREEFAPTYAYLRKSGFDRYDAPGPEDA